MKQDKADITIILDRTGSMEPIRDDTIGGFNRFVEDQKLGPGECLMTLVQFDSQEPFEMVYRAVSVKDVKPITRETYVPRAATPLLDAIGRGINDTGKRLSEVEEAERPGKVIFVVITDGLENASKEFKKATIKEMVERQREVYKWEFVFLGANMDAIQEGQAMGMAAAASLTVTPDAAGAKAAYASLGRATTAYRAGAAQNMAWSEEDRKQQERKTPR